MKQFINFINERLNREEWLKYDDEETPVSPESGTDIANLYNYIVTAMNTKSGNLLYTTSNMKAGEDFSFFKLHIIEKAEEQSTKTIHSSETQIYITSYLYDESKPFLLVEIRDPYEYSFVIINEKDFEFFDFETDPNYITIPRDETENMWTAFGQMTTGSTGAPTTGL